MLSDDIGVIWWKIGKMVYLSWSGSQCSRSTLPTWRCNRSTRMRKRNVFGVPRQRGEHCETQGNMFKGVLRRVVWTPTGRLNDGTYDISTLLALLSPNQVEEVSSKEMFFGWDWRCENCFGIVRKLVIELWFALSAFYQVEETSSNCIYVFIVQCYFN